VKLLRYKDPWLGPRKLPNFDKLTDEKSVISINDRFTVDTDNHVVTLQCADDSHVAIGSQLVYLISTCQ